MKNLKKIIVLGSGNSGAGGVHDYLLSREDTISPFYSNEFRLINDPDGIHDLYVALYEKFNINKSALSILRFKNFVKRLVNSNYNKKNKLYTDSLIKMTDEFIFNITETNYNGSPQFYFDRMFQVANTTSPWIRGGTTPGASNNSFTISVRPFHTASINGVLPFLSA